MDDKDKFVNEYNKLCKKYKKYIISEDYFCGVELASMRNESDTELHELLIEQLKETE